MDELEKFTFYSTHTSNSLYTLMGGVGGYLRICTVSTLTLIQDKEEATAEQDKLICNVLTYYCVPIAAKVCIIVNLQLYTC
jgi:hypothetical protein